MHATILAYMFQLVEEDKIPVPLFDPIAIQAASNAAFLQDYVATLIKQAFGHLSEWVYCYKMQQCIVCSYVAAVFIEIIEG